MPEASLQLALARHWELLKKLPSRGPGMTASDLTKYLRDEMGFAVSKRTVERDLIDLARLFGSRCNDDSIPDGWHWLPGNLILNGRPGFTRLSRASATPAR